MTLRIITGHVVDKLRELPSEIMHCVVTSPPYYGLRDYKIPPQVWGGEAGCEHEWGDERLISSQPQRDSCGGIGLAGTRGEQAYTNGASFSASQGAFCLRCGAWRGSLGLEPTLDLYLYHMVEVCRAVRRVLRKDGTFWLNIGDSYAGSSGSGGKTDKQLRNAGSYHDGGIRREPGLKPKDLLLVPARLAIRLQEDGWWVRSDIIWAKKAPMPESCTDRPTSAHEHVFLLTRSEKYFYDAEAVKEEGIDEPGVSRGGSLSRFGREEALISANAHRGDKRYSSSGKRNLRNVWHLGPSPFPEAHFATFPPELPRRAILAGTSQKGCCPKCGAGWARIVRKQFEPQLDVSVVRGMREPQQADASNHWTGFPRGSTVTETLGWRPSCKCVDVVGGDDRECICRRESTPGPCAWCGSDTRIPDPVPASVLDPFLGAGATALVADRLGRNCIGIELNSDYAEMSRERIIRDAGMFAEIAAE